MSERTDDAGPEQADVGPRRRRRWAWVLAVVVAVISTGIALAGTTSPADTDPLRSGAAGPAPDFTLPRVRDEGETLSLADRRGRPAVINFWASWCVPCRREMPVLEAAFRRHAEQVWFVGINHQDSREAAIAFLQETGSTYLSAYDPDGTTALEYGLFGLPTTVFVTVDGTINATRTGEITPEELDRAIADLLSDAAAPRPAVSATAMGTEKGFT